MLFKITNFFSEKGLMGGLQSIQEMILNLEINAVYENTIVCEPNLGFCENSRRL